MAADWVILALASAFLLGIERLIHRHVMKKEGHMSYTWLFSLLAGIFYLPLLFTGVRIPDSLFAWALMLFAAGVWTAIGVIGFKSYRYAQVSLRDPIARTDILFLLFFSALVLQEPMNVTKLAGALVIFSGLVALTFHDGRMFGKFSHRGVKLTLAAAVLSGFVAVVDKVAVAYFLPALYGFLMYFVPAVYLTPVALKNKQEIKSLISGKMFWVVAASVITVLSYYFQLSAYLITDVSNVFPILQLSTLVAVFGGYFVHKEKDLVLRVAGAVLMVAGSVLIVLP